MLNELITWVLNTYLGKYLEDFNPAQLSIALLSGEVELENVPIRRDALKSFGIPVQAVSGSIGKIKLQVPVRQFRTSPWSIVIERVYGVFEPKDLSDWDNEKEKQEEYEYKLNILDTKEAAWRIENGCNSESYYSLSYSSWLNYGTTLATNILENLELKIIDVHLRYEDTLTIPKSPFTSGIRIRSITAQSCDFNWAPGVKYYDVNNVSFKLLELNDLCVYWDELNEDNKCSNISSKNLLIDMNNLCKMENHKFIINPIIATGKFKRERCKEAIRNKNRPRVSCDIVLPEVKICLNEVQYKEIVNCIANLHSINKKKMFKILKGKFSNDKDVKMLWKYALACHGFNFLSNEEKWKILRDNIRYIKIYKRLLVNPTENLLKGDKEFKIEMEKIRPLSELKLLRLISCDSVSTKELNARSRNINQAKGILYHWFPNWLGWYASSSSTSDESYEKIEDDILIALKETIENDTFSKRDAIFANLTFALSNGSIHLTSTEVKSNKVALDLDFQNLISFVEVKPKFYSYCVGISLGSVCLNDMRTELTEFPNLIKPQIQESHKSLYKNFISLFTKKSLMSGDEEPCFQLQYEKNPVINKSDYRLTIKSKSLDVVYNEKIFKWLIKFFSSPINDVRTNMYSFTEKYVQPNRLKFLKNWKSALIGEKDYRKKWSFEIEISAPRIICVDNLKDKNSVVLLIDFGRFQLFKNERTNTDTQIFDNSEDNSDDELFMTPCSTPPGSKTSRSNSLSTQKTVANLYDNSVFSKFFINSDTGLENDIYCEIYDKYIINLTDLQVILCRNRECGYVCLKTTSNFHLLDKFNISIQIERRIINTLDPEYPAITLFGKLQKIAAHVNEQKISECLRILNNISFDLFESNSQINSSNKTLYDLDVNNKSDIKEFTNTTLFEFAIDNMILEVQSREKSIAELQIVGAKASITKSTGEINIHMSVHGFLLVDAIQSFGPDFELLIASHRLVEMDSISGSLKQSEPCSPSSPASPDPNGYQRSTSPYIINKVVNDLQTEKGNYSKADEALITIDVNIIEFSDDTEPIQIANITFNNLDVIANQETIVELLGFGKHITDNYNTFRSSLKRIENKTNKCFENNDQIEIKKFKTELSFDFHRLNILVPRSIRVENGSTGRKVGTLTMSEAKIHASLGIENEICVAGALGGIQVIDITPEGFCHQRIFSVGKDPLTDPPNLLKKDLMYSAANEMYSVDIDDTELQYTNALSFKINKLKDSSVIVKVRMASVWYTHCPRFIEEIYLCVKEFKQYLKNFVKSLRNRATNMAKGLVHHISSTRLSSKFDNIAFDVILNSPVLVLPRSCQSSEVFVANLGKFTMHNTFDPFENFDDAIRKDTYFLDIKNINLFSLNINKRSEMRGKVLPKANELYSCKTDAVAILYDTAVLFRCICVTKPSTVNTGSNFQQTFQIEGSVTQNLNICLSKSQYEQLFESLSYATNITILKEPINSSEKDVEPLVKSVVNNSKASECHNISFYFSVPILKLDLKNEFKVSIIHIIFKEFSFEKIDSKEKTEILLSLRSVIMEDLKCSQDSKYRNMVDSSNENNNLNRSKFSHSCPNIKSAASSDYIDKYKSMPTIPTDIRTANENMHIFKKQFNKNCIKENLVFYKSIAITNTDNDKEAQIKSSIDFNNLNLIVSIEKWFMVFDFFGLITSQAENSENQNCKNNYDNQNTSTKDLQITIRSLNLILVRNEAELTKTNISNVTFQIEKSEVINSIRGRLGSISVCDLTSFGRIYQEKFSTTGSEALSFKYKRIRKNETKYEETLKTLDVDAHLLIFMSSVRYFHTKRFIVEINLFIRELLQLQSPVMSRLKSSKAEREKHNSVYKIGLEVHAESPIILMPVSYNSNHMLIADLGKLTIVNSFHFSKDLQSVENKRTDLMDYNAIVELMNVDLVNINVVTGQREVISPKSSVRKNCNILCVGDFGAIKLGNRIFKEKCHLKLEIVRNTESNFSHNIPDFKVNATLTELNGIIDLQQYKLIRGFLNYNLGEVIEDVYYNYEVNLNESIEKLSSMTKVNTAYIDTNWITLSINFLLENVIISFAETNQLSSSSSPESTFACINFIKSTLEIDSFADGSQDIDLISSEILIMDSRQYFSESFSKNVFKYILKPSEEGASQSSVQAEIHSRRRNGTSKYTILLNNMRIMAILEYLEKLNNFLKEEPHLSTEQSKIIEQVSYVSTPHELTKTLVPESNSKYEFVLNITNSEIVFVENSEQIDTNAIILKSTTVFSYKPSNNAVPISIDINHLEIFSCILGSENESSLSIIDPFTLNMELRNKCFQIHLQNKTFLRISYNDAMLFSRIMQSLPKQTNKHKLLHSCQRSDFEKIAPLVAMGFKSSDCWVAMESNSFNINEAAIWLSQQKYKNSNALEINSISLNANLISVCVIDDCLDADVPLLEFSLSSLLLNQRIQSGDNKSIIQLYEGLIETVIAANYYNRRLSGWEPIIEPWSCTASWKYTKASISNTKRLTFQANSKQVLKFNITSTLIELSDLVRKNWSEDYSKHSAVANSNISCSRRRRLPFIPFALKNLTGEPLIFKTFFSHAGGITRTEVTQQDLMSNWISAQHNEIVPFDFGPQSKLRHLDSHKLNMHQILVQIHGWTLIGPISIDKVGTFFRYANQDMSYNKKTRIVFEISLVGSAQKLIIVRSALNIVNNTLKPFLLRMKVKNDKEFSMLTIDRSEKIAVPLRFVESHIYLKPLLERSNADDDYNRKDITSLDNEALTDDKGFCTNSLQWANCTTYDGVQNIHSCFTTSKIPFHVLSETKKDKYPIRDMASLPGHTITILPPLRIKNLLCCDLLFKIVGHAHGKINAAEEIEIYSVEANESFNLSITLDNYKLSGQLKIPMGHTGIVEPKLKLIDVLNRELFLRISIQSFPGKGMEIFIGAPIWIINKTGLPLIFRQEGTNQISSGQFDEHEYARDVSPLLFSFSDQEGSPLLEFRLGKQFGTNNPWCNSFGVRKEITFRELKAEQTKINYVIGVTVQRGNGLYSCTTFITLTPRFQMFNRSVNKLEFAQKCDVNLKRKISPEKVITALPESNFPFHWPNSEQEPLLCVRVVNQEYSHWSSGIPVNEAKSLYINIRNELGEMSFLRLEVILIGGTYILNFTDAYTLPPPIRIDNFSEVPIYFSQKSIELVWRTIVKPQSSLSYVMDDPLGPQMLLIEAPGGNLIEYSLKMNDCPKSITYANFIYIAFKETFRYSQTECDNENVKLEAQQLVLGVKDKQVIIMKKCTGDRSQLWLMNSYGQLEHEGSSPPSECKQAISKPRLVLDLEKPPNPTDYTRLVVRPQNSQRVTTQTWRFENGRLMCHANMCVQAANGIYGLKHGCYAVLGKIETNLRNPIGKSVPHEQSIEIQKLRPGSGHLEVICKMDGPIKSVQIHDVKSNLDEIVLAPDPFWNHASVFNRGSTDTTNTPLLDELLVKFSLLKGFGLSVVARSPCEELVYMTFEDIIFNIMLSPATKSLEFKVGHLQIDNQLLETQCPVILYTLKTNTDEPLSEALLLKAKLLASPNINAVIFEYFCFEIKPCTVIMEEKLILKLALFLGYKKYLKRQDQQANNHIHLINEYSFSKNTKRFYFENFTISPTQIRLSVLTASKLNNELFEIKRNLGLTLIKFEDAVIEFDRFSDRHHFETLEVYLKALKVHYVNQLKWHAASILGSVDFLGNPLGFANDLSEGVSGLIFEGSVKSLVKNVTHGISNSTAKLTETISDSLGRVVLDEHDNETRQKILEVAYPTSGGHLAAGLKGFGFGLLGGVTSIVRHTYVGAQSDGIPGFLSGLGKGIVGTVTKPLIGVLDLAAETASAVRETSRGTQHCLPDRKRLPRCVSGAPGGLLPCYSYRQSKGQQYLYIINRRNFNEKLIFYEPNLCNDKEAQLRLLVSTEYVRIFSRCEEDPAIMFECHLSEVLSCHPLTTNTAACSKALTNYYIEISTNVPKVTRPRIRCQNEEIAERASRCINYAKAVFDERELSVLTS